MAVNPKQARQAIEYLCNCLAYYGINYLNAQVFRQAKLGNSQVQTRFWNGIFSLIILHFQGFKIRNIQLPDPQLVQQLVSYILYKWECPVQPSNSQSLLLAFGFTIHYTDFFSQYQSKFISSPTPFASIEELNSKAQEFLSHNLPSISEVTPMTVFSVYRALLNEVHQTFRTVHYIGNMIYSLHQQDPSLDLQDIWVAESQERIQKFQTYALYQSQVDTQKKNELKHRTVFWKWMEAFADTFPDSSVPSQPKGPPANEFSAISVDVLADELDRLVNQVQEKWQQVQSLKERLEEKWTEVSRELENRPDWDAYIESVSQQMAQKFISLAAVTDRLAGASNIPGPVPLQIKPEKDRSEGEEVLLKKLAKLETDLQKMQANLRKSIGNKLQLIPHTRIFNL